MRRLHVKLFFALMVAMTVYVACWNVIEVWLEPRDPDQLWTLERFERLAPEILPDAASSEAELRQELERLRDIVGVDVAVYGHDGTLLAFAGDPLPTPEAGARGWFAGSETRPVVALRLDGGRTLVAAPAPPIPGERPELLALAVFVPMILLATYVLTRWMTRRIDDLTLGVDRLGQGDLDTRVPVRGADEISVLAQGFNRAAARIQQLVGAQRSMLAMVSHELRSPLARLRVAVELQAERPDPEMQRQARRDIAELDELIEQLLLASRLQAGGVPERRDSVDLLALAAEEGRASERMFRGRRSRSKAMRSICGVCCATCSRTPSATEGTGRSRPPWPLCPRRTECASPSRIEGRAYPMPIARRSSSPSTARRAPPRTRRAASDSASPSCARSPSTMGARCAVSPERAGVRRSRSIYRVSFTKLYTPEIHQKELPRRLFFRTRGRRVTARPPETG